MSGGRRKAVVVEASQIPVRQPDRLSRRFGHPNWQSDLGFRWSSGGLRIQLDYTIEDSADRPLILKAGKFVAGHVSEDAEHPGLWVLEDAAGHLMGRRHERENGAAFLPMWFAADEQDQR